MFVQNDGPTYSPGETMIVRRLPCVECGATPARYIERRLCVKCYRRKAKRRGLGKLPSAELFNLWTAPHGGCLVWLGHISPDGYGKIRMQYAHRFSYELYVGTIPEGLELDHLCRNRWCVKPDHLEPVTHAENLRRAAEIKTHCPWGHEYGPENPRGNCRPCRRDYMRALYARKKLERAGGSTQSEAS